MARRTVSLTDELYDPGVTDAGARAVRALNRKLHGDGRVDLSMVPIGDGLSLVRKR